MRILLVIIFVCLSFSVFAQDDIDTKKAVANSYRENVVSIKAFLERDHESGMGSDIVLTYELTFNELPNLVLESMYLKKKDSVFVAKEYISCEFDVRSIQYLVSSDEPRLVLSNSTIYIGEEDWSPISQNWVSRNKEKSPQTSCQMYWSPVIDMNEFKTYLSEIIRLNQIIRSDKSLNPWDN